MIYSYKQILLEKVNVSDLDLIVIENGALIEYLLEHVFAFSEYLSKNGKGGQK